MSRFWKYNPRSLWQKDIFSPPQQRMADQILTQLKQHPDAWTRVDTILEYSNNQQTKVHYGLPLVQFSEGSYFWGHVLNFFPVFRAPNTRSSDQDTMESSPSRTMWRLVLQVLLRVCQRKFAFFVPWEYIYFEKYADDADLKVDFLWFFRHKEVHCRTDNKNFIWGRIVGGVIVFRSLVLFSNISKLIVSVIVFVDTIKVACKLILFLFGLPRKRKRMLESWTWFWWRYVGWDVGFVWEGWFPPKYSYLEYDVISVTLDNICVN